MPPTEIDPVVVRRDVGAPIEDVWRAWTDPEVVARWFSPNPALAVVADTGGGAGDAWSVMMGPFAVRGEYVEVAAPHRLAFTWAFDHEPDTAATLAEVDLRAVANGTSIVVTHGPFTDQAERDGVEEGWTLSLDRLVALPL